MPGEIPALAATAAALRPSRPLLPLLLLWLHLRLLGGESSPESLSGERLRGSSSVSPPPSLALSISPARAGSYVEWESCPPSLSAPLLRPCGESALSKGLLLRNASRLLSFFFNLKGETVSRDLSLEG